VVQVWKAKCLPFDEMVAIKILNLDQHDTRVLVPPTPPSLSLLFPPSLLRTSSGRALRPSERAPCRSYAVALNVL
jgi:hypothetical protein